MKKRKKLKTTTSRKSPKRKKAVLSIGELLKKYPYLNKHRNIRTRQDYIDIDEKFLHDLCKDQKAAEIYNQFCKEFYNADYRDQVFVKEGSKLKKQLNQEHYARQNCIYNIKKSTGLLSTFKPDILNKNKKNEGDN